MFLYDTVHFIIIYPYMPSCFFLSGIKLFSLKQKSTTFNSITTIYPPLRTTPRGHQTHSLTDSTYQLYKPPATHPVKSIFLLLSTSIPVFLTTINRREMGTRYFISEFLLHYLQCNTHENSRRHNLLPTLK